jgi:hypothetical protein
MQEKFFMEKTSEEKEKEKETTELGKKYDFITV